MRRPLLLPSRADDIVLRVAESPVMPRPINQLVPLPRMVLDQLAEIPLDHLIELVIGMKTGAVHVAIEMPPGATGGDHKAVEGTSNSGFVLKILEDELARRRQ